MAKEPRLTGNHDEQAQRDGQGTRQEPTHTSDISSASTSAPGRDRGGEEAGAKQDTGTMAQPSLPPKVRGAREPILPLIAVLILAAALRSWLLFTPFGEVEADEAVIGLMARHILAGEWPVFYWGQAYLGSLEAFVTAAMFVAFGPSLLVLKIVPALFSLLFIALVYQTARVAYGTGPALLTALYFALPPAFFGIWSIKTRGGYIELLALGQLVFLLVLLVERPGQRWNALWAGLLGLLAGLTFWTNVLAVVYLAPALGLLLVRRRQQLLRPATASLIAGFVVGSWPLIWYNIANDFATWRQLFSGSFRVAAVMHNLAEQVRYSGPIVVGLAQASTAHDLFVADLATRPGRWIVVPLVLALLSAIVAVAFRKSILRSLKPGGGIDDLASSLALLLVAANLLATSATRFGELATEPRYLMPIYSTVPLFAVAAWRLRPRSPIAFGAVLLCAFTFNLYSLVTADPRLNLPSNIGATDTATRADLARFLEERNLTRVYTDYWIAYPLALQSEERILPAIASGGFDRYIPYVHNVSVATNPAFVFVAGRPEEAEFRKRLAELGASIQRDEVSIYVVYHDVQPTSALTALRGG